MNLFADYLEKIVERRIAENKAGPREKKFGVQVARAIKVISPAFDILEGLVTMNIPTVISGAFDLTSNGLNVLCNHLKAKEKEHPTMKKEWSKECVRGVDSTLGHFDRQEHSVGRIQVGRICGFGVQSCRAHCCVSRFTQVGLHCSLWRNVRPYLSYGLVHVAVRFSNIGGAIAGGDFSDLANDKFETFTSWRVAIDTVDNLDKLLEMCPKPKQLTRQDATVVNEDAKPSWGRKNLDRLRELLHMPPKK